MHTWAPILLKCPELAVTPEELDSLTGAYNDFAAHHAVPEMTEKRLSEINLAIAVVMVYGTRVIAIAKRKSDERKHGPQVVPMQARQQA